MNLRAILSTVPSLGFIIDQMEILSGPGRRVMMDQQFLTQPQEITAQLSLIDQFLGIDLTDVGHALMQIRDIPGTVKRLAQKAVLDDIELFEIKSFALMSVEVKDFVNINDIRGITIPDLHPVIELLDPEKTGVPHFYIYDCYDPTLKSIRQDYKTHPCDELFMEMAQVEQRVREDLSAKLWKWANDFSTALDNCGKLDLMIAKYRLADKLNLCCPRVVDGITSFTGLVNPVVADSLAQRGRAYQPVDLEFSTGATVITGANMAGKTVILKTAALAQAMMQLGYYVPARCARIVPVEDILVSMGDSQSESSGLSSFGSEILRISSIINRMESGKKYLVLVDEPARTTNPVEGWALVNAFVSMAQHSRSLCLVTTHYSGLQTQCNRLRVKGFTGRDSVTVSDLDLNIDYSLIPDTDDQVPHEALRIAQLLGVNPRFVECAKTFMN